MKPLATLNALATATKRWAGAANVAALFILTALALAVLGQPAAAATFTVGVGSYRIAFGPRAGLQGVHGARHDAARHLAHPGDRKSTRLNSSHRH